VRDRAATPSCDLGALRACGPVEVKGECTLPSTSPQPTTGSSPQLDQVGTSTVTPIVAIDGTPSMQGFVNIPGSHYVSTLRLIDSAITAFEKSNPPSYYSFGTEIMPLAEQKSTEAQSPSFYGRSAELQDTQIEKAIAALDNVSGDKLAIVVTDLYHINAEIIAIIRNLRTHYLDKGYAVGIVAVRSEFDGVVYDVGLENEYFPYQTNPDDPETFHPFYVIVLGTYNNVEYFFDQLKESSKSQEFNLPAEQFVIFNSQSRKKRRD